MHPAAVIEDSPMATHLPVMVERVRELLAPRPGAIVVDATLGLGGHAAALLPDLVPGGRLIGIDRDRVALDAARARLAAHADALVTLHGRHEELDRLLDGVGVRAVDGILLDLGVSSMQLDEPERGFSFRHDGPLDMRMDRDETSGAAALVATADEATLARIIRVHGEERGARRIARAIVRERQRSPIETTARLARIVRDALGPAARRYRIDPATRTFQALRIAVNREVEGLGELTRHAVDRLVPGGTLAVIAYHSLEDRAVKRGLRELMNRCVCPPGLPVCGCGRRDIVRSLTRGAERPGDDEIERNPRSRSARLRAVERL